MADALDDISPAPSTRHSSPALPAHLRSRFVDAYRAQWPFIVRLVRRLGVAAEAAEDVAQEVFLVMHSRLPELEPGRPLHAWLRSVAVRVSSNHRRAVQRRVRRADAGEPVDPDSLAGDGSREPEASLAARELRACLGEAIARLTPAQRQVFVLALLEQHTALEIASLMRVSPNTVSSRLRAVRLDCARSLHRYRGGCDRVERRGRQPLRGRS